MNVKPRPITQRRSDSDGTTMLLISDSSIFSTECRRSDYDYLQQQLPSQLKVTHGNIGRCSIYINNQVAYQLENPQLH